MQTISLKDVCKNAKTSQIKMKSNVIVIIGLFEGSTTHNNIFINFYAENFLKESKMSMPISHWLWFYMNTNAYIWYGHDKQMMSIRWQFISRSCHISHTSDAYPGVAPATGLAYEPTGELLCTASQKARRRSRFPSCTAWRVS